METLTLLVRTLITYVLLVVVMRLGGKRQIGELQLSELITALLISEIASAPITSLTTPLSYAAIPVATVIALEVLFTFLTTKSQLMKRLLDGRPSVVIDKGKLNISELGKLRMSVEELIGESRRAGICDLSDIQYAILEENGKFSFFEKAENGEKERGIAHTLIVDGCISRAGLEATSLTEEQLTAMLIKKGVKLHDVFLFTLNDAGEAYLVKNKKN
ncbi:MAG: DUF421 domain-containing protein [Clostridia bacterium]|nr:DUF421 domain-containing protein [Clostridia bacterium]